MASQKRHSQPWYSEGLRFECQRCGGCCSGPSGYVELTSEEAVHMAEFLGISLEEFKERYTRTEYAPNWYLKEVPSKEHGLDCIMLERESEPPFRTGCKVHKCRPQQCSTWPFWPSNLRSAAAWKTHAQNCPGFNRGPLFSLSAIEKLKADSGLEDF